MEFYGEVGIFEEMSSQDEDDGLARFHESSLTQFLESCQGDGGGGFATDAVGSDFGFGGGDLNFADFFDLAARCLEYAQSLLPRCRITDADGGGERVGGHWLELRIEFGSGEFAHRAVERIRALRLNDRKLG